MNTSIAQLFSLDNQCVLVTGASSGLGGHFARTLAAAGAKVALAARRTDRLQDLVREIQAAGGQAHAFELDVTDRASVNACLDAVLSEFGPIDVLVNNAGVSDTKRALDYQDADWDRIFDTNLKGAWIVAQEAAKRMVEQARGGNLINVCSILGSRVSGGVSPYSAAKAGLLSLTRSMALELARHDIRVNALSPGYVITELNAEFLRSADGDKLRSRIPTRRFSEMADLDGVLLLLASNASRAMTGADVVVDGGHLCSGL